MVLIRHMMEVIVLSLILAIGGSSMAVASGGIDQQEHCADAFDAESHDATAGVAHNHEMDGSSHKVSEHDHDHDSCVSHTCPVLFPNPGNSQDLVGFLLATLTMQDHALHVVARAESLHRPPNT